MAFDRIPGIDENNRMPAPVRERTAADLADPSIAGPLAIRGVITEGQPFAAPGIYLVRPA